MQLPDATVRPNRRDPVSGGAVAIALCMALLVGSSPAVAFAEDASDFLHSVVPVLQTHCVRCHHPGNEKGGISLATPADLHSGDFVLPDDPDASPLIELVTGEGDDPPRMPQEGPPLSADEVEMLRRWIAGGAHWPDDVVIREQSKADTSWWSLQPLAVAPAELDESQARAALSELPIDTADAWVGNPIDRFVLAELIKHQLHPNAPADRRTLIRRATYDLTGLPPSPEEVEAFAASDDPGAYEALIDRLLASPHYGERWGRHWLDVVRFGESNGYERNVLIHTLWPFRDYVIDSFNADKPFDRFIREHLAGVDHQLPTNQAPNHLHGGEVGFGNWSHTVIGFGCRCRLHKGHSVLHIEPH
jgi:hypothetical protein